MYSILYKTILIIMILILFWKQIKERDFYKVLLYMIAIFVLSNSISLFEMKEYLEDVTIVKIEQINDDIKIGE